MKVLVACEESQRVCKAFRDRGFEAYSNDLMDCSGGHPEWHIKQDARPLLDGNCTFRTLDTHTHTSGKMGSDSSVSSMYALSRFRCRMVSRQIFGR